MGMTIEECEAILSGRIENPLESSLSKEAFAMAIDTMRKYQKIEQILKSLDDGEINYPQMAYYLREVIEDGKID